MSDHNPMTLLRQCCDMLAGDLDGQPLDIPRQGKEDVVLVSSATCSKLMNRIATLEAHLQTEAEREAEEEELLRMMVDAANSGRLH